MALHGGVAAPPQEYIIREQYSVAPPPPAYCSRESAVLQPHLQNEVQSPCCYADYSTMDNEAWEEYPSTSNAVQHKNAECKQKNTSNLRWHWIRQFVKGVLLLIRGKDSIWLRFILIIWMNPHTMKTCYFGHGSKRYDVQFVSCLFSNFVLRILARERVWPFQHSDWSAWVTNAYLSSTKNMLSAVMLLIFWFKRPSHSKETSKATSSNYAMKTASDSVFEVLSGPTERWKQV